MVRHSAHGGPAVGHFECDPGRDVCAPLSEFREFLPRIFILTPVFSQHTIPRSLGLETQM